MYYGLILSIAMVGLMLNVSSLSANDKHPLMGIHEDFVWTEDADIGWMVQAMKDAGVEIVRLPVRWNVLESDKGKWDFKKLDSVVKAFRAADIQVLALMCGVPAWASRIDPKKESGFWDCYPPKDIQDWNRFIMTCVKRYKQDIHYWEIWNEENGASWYRPEPDAKGYVSLLRSSYQTIKRLDGKAQVLLGGLQLNGIIPNPWEKIKTENFMQSIYDAGGKPYFDIVNIHPYVFPVPGTDQTAKLLVSQVRDTVSVMKKNSDAAKPLWITETGTYTGNGVTEDMQAQHLTDTFTGLAQIPQVKAIFWLLIRDLEHGVAGGPETSMGLITRDKRLKPAYKAYRDVAYKLLAEKTQ